MDWYLTDGKSRITREIHAVKKTREFYDNEGEIISGESELLRRCGTIYNVQAILMSLSPHRGCGAYSRAALINFFVPDVALIRVNTVAAYIDTLTKKDTAPGIAGIQIEPTRRIELICNTTM